MVNGQGCHSFTALMLASAQGRFEVVRTLLEHPKLYVYLRDDQGRAPFWWAAAGGYSEIVQLLANQSGVKKRLYDSNGRTAYAIAKKRKHGISRFIYEDWITTLLNHLFPHPLPVELPSSNVCILPFKTIIYNLFDQTPTMN
jgi:ankyrin repeat protein